MKLSTWVIAVVISIGICSEAAATYRCRVTADSLYIRPRAGSYFQGVMYKGHAFDVQYVDSNNWAYGYGYGYVNRCGWTQRGYMAQVNEGANTYCRSSPKNIADSEFMGDGPWGGCCDGERITVGCGVYCWDNWIDAPTSWGNHNYRGYFVNTTWYRRYATKDLGAWAVRWNGASDWSFIRGCY